MGADIYLRSLYEPAYEKAHPIFEAAYKARDALTGVGRFDQNNPEHAAAQAKVDEAYEAMYAVGYFRDSYNRTSLFAFLGVSWWQSAGVMRADGSPYTWEIGGEGEMQVPSMVALRDFLRERGEVTCDQMQAWRTALDDDDEHRIPDEGDDSLTEWGKMFERKRRRLIKLLEQAIALGEPLDCSV